MAATAMAVLRAARDGIEIVGLEMLQDLDHDGIVDYLNVRIYVANNPAPTEIAAAANLAARLAFETLSMDLPIGFTVSFRMAEMAAADDRNIQTAFDGNLGGR